MTKRKTEIPRPFMFKKLGEGNIIEEAVVEYKTWAPAFQLLKFTDGSEMLRFCYYAKSGQIAPRALSLNDEDVDNLREEIKKKPKVRKFLQRLLSDE
jgi:hypothetical protein